MYLPSKHITEAQSLVVVGAQILAALDQPRTVSACLEAVGRWRTRHGEVVELPFWWYVLALDALYVLGLVQLTDDVLVRIENA